MLTWNSKHSIFHKYSEFNNTQPSLMKVQYNKSYVDFK